MPRISKFDFLTIHYGGKWTYDIIWKKSWVCDDGRICYVKKPCKCWMFPMVKGQKCRCPTHYEMDDGTIVVFDDPRIYRLNGLKLMRY